LLKPAAPPLQAASTLPIYAEVGRHAAHITARWGKYHAHLR